MNTQETILQLIKEKSVLKQDVNQLTTDIFKELKKALQETIEDIKLKFGNADQRVEFYYKNIIRIPSPKNETLEFGSAIHYALEMFFVKMKNA